MRWLAIASLGLALLFTPAASAAKPLTAQDVRGLLAVSGFNPGTSKLLGDKGIHELTSVKVHRYKGWWVVLVREKEVPLRFSTGAMGPPPNQLTVPVDISLFLNMLEVLGVVGSLFWTSFKLGARVQEVEGSLSGLKTSMKDIKDSMIKLDSVITEIAVSNKRLDLFDQRMDDIVTGRTRIGNGGRDRGRH